MYKAVGYRVLLCGKERWVLIYDMLNVMEMFHHQMDWRIAVISSWQVGESIW